MRKRLNAVMNDIPPGGMVLDIGCDHGQLTHALARDGRWERVIGCDCSFLSLEKARKTQSAAEFRLGDGLGVLRKGEYADVVVMAGLGGLLMLEILRNGWDQLNHAALVLQPQGSLTAVRVWLHSHGYRIASERLLLEDGWWYDVIVGEKGDEGYQDELGYLTGRLEGSELWDQWIERELHKRKLPFEITSGKAAGTAQTALRQRQILERSKRQHTV